MVYDFLLQYVVNRCPSNIECLKYGIAFCMVHHVGS